MLPKSNEHYKDVSYWNARYSNESNKDWLLTFSSLRNVLEKAIIKEDRILMLGCGNSLLSEEMARAGYMNITNIDYSEVVISNMQGHCDLCSKLKWVKMDARHLQFDDATFDVVLEKATVDSFLVDEKDAWSISEENSALIDKVLVEVSRVLKPGGRFLSVSFSQPHFRGALYGKNCFDWSLEAEEVGNDFHYYIYIMTRGEALSQNSIFTYVPPTITKYENCKSLTEPECDSHFLNNIEI